MYPFIWIQKKIKSTVNIRGFIHEIMPRSLDDENSMLIEFIIVSRNARHINAKSKREESTNGRRPMRVLSEMKMNNAAINMKMAGNANLSSMVEFMIPC